MFIQTMTTYHQYQSESKQAEQKLRGVQQQMAKKSVKKQKSMEKRVEKVKRNRSVERETFPCGSTFLWTRTRSQAGWIRI